MLNRASVLFVCGIATFCLCSTWASAPAHSDGPKPRPTLDDLAVPSGNIRFDCENEDWFDVSGPNSKTSSGPNGIALTADMDRIGPDTERIWHVVRNNRDASISFGWRASRNPYRTLIEIPHGDGLKEGSSACAMNEGGIGSFAASMPSDFRYNTSGWSQVNATHYDLSVEQQEPAGLGLQVAETRFLMLRQADDGSQWLGTEFHFTRIAGEGIRVTMQTYPQGSALMVEQSAFQSVTQLDGGDVGMPEPAPLSSLLPDLTEADDSALNEIRDRSFYRFEWSEGGRVLDGSVLEDTSALVILIDPEGRPALLSGMGFAVTPALDG